MLLAALRIRALARERREGQSEAISWLTSRWQIMGWPSHVELQMLSTTRSVSVRTITTGGQTHPAVMDITGSDGLSVAMKLNWKSVNAAHVTRACEAVLNSAGARPKPGNLIVIYKDKKLPAKTILRIAYCLANNISSETKLKFASSEGSLQLLRSLGFRAERLQTNHPVADKD